MFWSLVTSRREKSRKVSWRKNNVSNLDRTWQNDPISRQGCRLNISWHVGRYSIVVFFPLELPSVPVCLTSRSSSFEEFFRRTVLSVADRSLLPLTLLHLFVCPSKKSWKISIEMWCHTQTRLLDSIDGYCSLYRSKQDSWKTMANTMLSIHRHDDLSSQVFHSRLCMYMTRQRHDFGNETWFNSQLNKKKYNHGSHMTSLLLEKVTVHSAHYEENSFCHLRLYCQLCSYCQLR